MYLCRSFSAVAGLTSAMDNKGTKLSPQMVEIPLMRYLTLSFVEVNDSGRKSEMLSHITEAFRFITMFSAWHCVIIMLVSVTVSN